MTAAREIEMLVQAISKVPDKKFRIAELAPRLIDDQGEVDVNACVDHAPELTLAIREVEIYIKDTRTLIRALDYLREVGE